MATPSHPAPRRHDPEGRRRAIITAAAELVIENGPATLTHRAVAARAGVALGSTTQYFASIDELRELALQQLADEIDEELASMEQTLADLTNAPERAAEVMYEFLNDPRQVSADIACMTAGTVDPARRELALRWFERLVDMIAQHIGRERATALAVYLDGATMHAGLHDAPLGKAEFTNVIRALATMHISPKA